MGLAKLNKVLKSAKGKYGKESDVYNTFLSNKKQFVPLDTLTNSKIDNKKLATVISKLGQSSQGDLAMPGETNALRSLNLEKLNDLDLSALENLNFDGLRSLENLKNLEGLGKLGDINLSKLDNLSALENLKNLDGLVNLDLSPLKNLNNLANSTTSKSSSGGGANDEVIKLLSENLAKLTENMSRNNYSPGGGGVPNLSQGQSYPTQQSAAAYPQSYSAPVSVAPSSTPVQSTSSTFPSNYDAKADSELKHELADSMKSFSSVVDALKPAVNVVSKNYIDVNKRGDDEDDEKEAKHEAKLAKLPDSILKETKTDWEPINYRGIDVSYDLYDLSKVRIKFDEKEQKILYSIHEPELTDEEKEKLDQLKKAFIYVFEKVTPENVGDSGRDLIAEGAKKLATKYKIKLDEEQLNKLIYYLNRDFLGLEELEPIMHDPYIEDVSCDGLKTPIFVNHLKYGPLEVNRTYTDSEKLNSFIIKLAQRSNQEVSLSKPILQGALPDGSRVEAIYGKEISEKGSSYTIRKFRAEPFTPIHLIEFGTCPPFVLAYLWLAIENRQSLLVSGGTATGKTTILNALSLFAPPSSKIVSIEDTPEINLPHEHWLSLVARESEGKSEVSMFDLLKASLRERPDYIIVGEIRGAEAAILFQGMATGHAGMGTVHAEKFEDLVNRMTIAPINLPKQLLTELNIVVFMKQIKVKNNMVRRVNSIVEVVEYNNRTDKFTTNEFVKFLPQKDEFELQEKSAILSKLLDFRGGKEESLWTEIERRKRILDTMHKEKLIEFNDVSEIIKAYYKEPGSIFDFIKEFKQKKINNNGSSK